MIPNNWFETADKIVRATIESHLDEYNSVQKFGLPDPARVILGGTNPLSDVSGVKLEEYMNYFELDPVPEEDFEAEVLSKSLKAAREIAFTVDFQIRRRAQMYGTSQWERELKRLRAIDIFKKANGEPNLNIHFVRSTSVVNPDALTFGWISYKFLFACG